MASLDNRQSSMNSSFDLRKGTASCTLDYASIGCNRTPQAVDWGENELVAFGACFSVVLYEPKNNKQSCVFKRIMRAPASTGPNFQRDEGAGKIVCFLNGHSGRVNCVQWIRGSSTDAKLVSGSTDKTVCLWKEFNGKLILRQQLNGHSNAVCSVAAISLPCESNSDKTERTLIASSGADSTLKIWQGKDNEDLTCTQTLAFGNGFALCVALAVLPTTKDPVLAWSKPKYSLLQTDGTDNHFVCVFLKLIKPKIQFWHAGAMIQIYISTLRKTIKTGLGVTRKLWFTRDFRCVAKYGHTETDPEENDTLLLASGAQDCFIRIWKFGLKKNDDRHNNIKELRLDEKTFVVTTEKGSQKEFSVVLDSVLAGHDGWVYGVKWKPSFSDGNKQAIDKLYLLSASMDKTMILWQPDEESGVWLDKARMGEVGGNTLGLYGCACSPDGDTVLAHGYQGAFHLWKRITNKEKISETWESEVTISGHFGPIEDFDWNPEGGKFIVSVSSDQTARLHGPWRRKGKEATWHEIARPQIHGHDMRCIAMINGHKFASGAEEKVIRIFQAPGSFCNNLETICGVQRDEKMIENLPLGASIPPLGLSNKAVFKGDIESWKDLDDPSRPMKASAFASEDPAPFKPMTIAAPPPEDVLLQSTLWPEVQKLYGHGFEVFCLACNPQGTILASACKASKAEHANILLWDTSSWKQLASLEAHSLTVTNMSFSYSGKWLLSVSRDRTWALFRKATNGENENNYSLVQKTDKKTGVHTRIIWSCSWTHDDQYFVTGSRDKKVIIWSCGSPSSSDNSWKPISKPLDAGESVTAIDVAPTQPIDKSYLIGVGLENGQIKIYSWLVSREQPWNLFIELPKSICPTLTVKRLKWNRHNQMNSNHTEEDTKLQLAVGSSDSSLRIISISSTAV